MVQRDADVGCGGASALSWLSTGAYRVPMTPRACATDDHRIPVRARMTDVSFGLN
jgi:hypothetical protein